MRTTVAHGFGAMVPVGDFAGIASGNKSRLEGH